MAADTISDKPESRQEHQHCPAECFIVYLSIELETTP
jgi:hypothetical protein